MAHAVILPGGGRLTPRRFQQLGLVLGMSNGLERVHYLMEEAFVPGATGRQLSYSFLRHIENFLWFETNPIYAILHESIYCEGISSNWSAERVQSEYGEFKIDRGHPVFFTGEMVYPWMFDDYKHLKPLKDAGEILAAYDGWPLLYDKSALESNTVACAAAIYYGDMYVERTLSEETAQGIRGIKLWVTNEYDHDGLRVEGEKVLGRLLNIVHGET